MSCTKSVVGLAVGSLIADGALTDLEQPVWRFYPEWKQGAKQRITLRHLLNHTSGLQNLPSAEEEINHAPDAVRLALAAELTAEPGTRFSYNNKAVNLLAGIVQRASGRTLDADVADRLFAPLGIADFDWTWDPAGNPYGMAGLALHATDLAKIGQLVLNRGQWDGRPIVGPDWLDASLAAGQPYNPLSGLLWWRIPAWTRIVVDEARLAELATGRADAEVLAAIRPMTDVVFASQIAYFQALEGRLGPDWADIVARAVDARGLTLARRTYGEIVGFMANGWLGQYLVILPASRIVAVRLVRTTL